MDRGPPLFACDVLKSLAGSYSYVIGTKGFSVALGGLGVVFTPFFMTPVVISWFFKRYITQLYYNPETDVYSAHHYGLFLNKKVCSFKKDEVKQSEATSMLNTFTVGKKPFFLHDEDLNDVDSVKLYRRMLGISNSESEPSSIKVHSDKIKPTKDKMTIPKLPDRI